MSSLGLHVLRNRYQNSRTPPRLRACDERAPEYAPRVKGRTRPGPRGSLAVQRRVALGVAAACALLGLVACSTYGADLLTQSQPGVSPTGGGSAAIGGSNATSVGGSSSGGGSSVAGGVVGAGAGLGNGSTEAGAAGADGSTDNGGVGGSVGVGGSGATSSGGHAGSTSAAGGGVGGSAGSSVAGAPSGGAGGGSAIELIDDFEDQDLVVLLENGRNGPWYPLNDGTAAGVQTFGVVLLKGADVRAGSTSTAALQMTASGFTDWGAGFGADFVNMAATKVPYDVSAYKGIRFYAKIGSGAQSALKLLIPTVYSDPKGGKCDPSATAKVGTQCNDHPYCAINSVTTSWAVYECDFSALVQQSFGLPQLPLDPTSVYGVQFTFVTKVLAADFWLDDIAFVLK